MGNPLPDDVYIDLSRPDATSGFDRRYDAVSMGRASGAGLSVRDKDDNGYAVQFDASVSEVGVERRYYPLRVTTPLAGPTVLEVSLEGDWNPMNSVSLIDTKVGRTLLLDGGIRYEFQMQSLREEGRFLVAVNHVKVDGNGKLPGFDVRVLGNPVRGQVLDMLITHPKAQPRHWTVVDLSGRTVGSGDFFNGRSDVQHRLEVPSMRQPGMYVLKVQMDNGEEKLVKVVRQ